MNIPIRNIYYLLCYAWDYFKEGEFVEVDLDGAGPTVNLLGSVLETGVTHLLKRGLGREYVVKEDDLSGIRGKIQVSQTVKRNLRVRGRTVCAFDELDHDILPNRILKATIRQLLSAKLLEIKLHARLMGIYRRLHDISDIDLSHRSFRTVQLHRNARLYSFLMSVCRLIHDNLLVSEEVGQSRFRDFIRDEQQMRYLFERFVFNFLKQEQQYFSVSRPHIKWDVTATQGEGLEFLPIMKTDIVLTSDSRQIIIDTKFVPKAFDTSYSRSHPKIRSAHLYQIHSYLTNVVDVKTRTLEGVLLYPTVDQEFLLSYQIRGRSIQVRSIDLAQPWEIIRKSLLGLTAA